MSWAWGHFALSCVGSEDVLITDSLPERHLPRVLIRDGGRVQWVGRSNPDGVRVWWVVMKMSCWSSPGK